MGKFSKIILSGSTDGQGIVISATTPTGTILHTAITGQTDAYDEVWLYAYSAATIAQSLTLMVGVTTATGSRLTHTIPADDLNGLVLIYPGLPIKNAKVIKGSATTAAAFNMFGFANRFTT